MIHKKNITKLLFSILSIVSMQVALISQEGDVLQAALSFTDKGDYKNAILEYEKLIALDYTTAEIEYNLGTCYLKERDGAGAIIHLRRALKFEPKHSAAQANLKIARKIVDTDISLIPDFFLLRYWRTFYKMLSSSSWTLLSLLFGVGIVGSVYYWLFPNSSQTKRISFIAGIALSSLMILATLAAYGKYSNEISIDQAVVSTESEFYTGADVKSESLGSLSAGVECTILDEIGEYLKIQLRDKEVGWILKDKLTII